MKSKLFFLSPTKSKNFQAFTLVALCMISLSSCFGVKPGSVRSGKNLFETFFVGEQGTQYFIKPLTFTNIANEKMILDLTFRYKNAIKDSAIINISFLSNEVLRNVDSLNITSGASQIILKNFKPLFTERQKNYFNLRVSTKGGLVGVCKLFKQNDWNVTLFSKDVSKKYTSPNDTKKKLGKLDFEIFSLF